MKTKIVKARLGIVEPWLIIILIIFGAIALFSFSSCVNQRKVEKWNERHPEEAARYAAATWPPKSDTTINVTVDSSEYTAAMAELTEGAYYLRVTNDSLMNLLQTTDTSCGRYLHVIKSLQQMVYQLQEKAKHIKPVVTRHDSTITKNDTSKRAELTLQITRLSKKVDELTKENVKLHGQANTRLWMSIAGGLSSLLLLILLFKKKKIPFLSSINLSSNREGNSDSTS